MGLVPLLWRALVVFRVAALGYALALILRDAAGYQRPGLAWLVAAVMVVWTGSTAWAYASPARRGWPLLGVDLAVAVVVLAVSPWVIGAAAQADTLPAVWVGAPVIAWALRGGWQAGALAAAVVAAVDLAIRWEGSTIPQATINATVLLLFVGVITGYVARLAGRAEQQLQAAAQQEAATRERERLARGIHDSVLQVLALVQRRGVDLGGEAAVLGRLAGEQEATLRALVAADPAADPAGGPGGESGEAGADPSGSVDLRSVLQRFAGGRTSVSTPAEPVPVPGPVAAELAAAVGAALDNVRVHCGDEASAWLLLEDEPTVVTVTVRDDGPGVPPGRLAQAVADGRLGVAQSIEGRLRDLGGTATITSTPGQGTEVELVAPRRGAG